MQDLRYKLQKRVRRVNSVDPAQFPVALTQFWAFFDAMPTFVGIAQHLTAEQPAARETVDMLFAGQRLVGTTEEEAAAIGHEVLRRLAHETNLGTFITLAGELTIARPKELGEAVEVLRGAYLEPFYEYIDEALDDQRAMLALLIRYKRRSEWFHRERLWQLQLSDSRNAERHLALGACCTEG